MEPNGVTTKKEEDIINEIYINIKKVLLSIANDHQETELYMVNGLSSGDDALGDEEFVVMEGAGSTGTYHRKPVKCFVNKMANKFSVLGHSHNYIIPRGNNLISAPSDDTVYNWGYGINYQWYSSNGRLNSQPGQYMHILTISPYEGEIGQIAQIACNGALVHRGGNMNGWGLAGWRTVYDSANSNPSSIQSSAPATNYLWAY